MNYMNVRDIMEYVLKYRLDGYKGVTFDINPISKDNLTSLESGVIDQSARIEIDNRLQTLLNGRELNSILQFNRFLQNVEFDPALEKETNEFLKEYLK